jgi:hypothetical protein
VLKFVAILVTLTTPAMAQAAAYLAEATPAAALARSQQECAVHACDGTQTIFWWSTVTLTNGTAAVIIMEQSPYTTTGLTTAEISALQTPAQIAPLLPIAPALP